jgi:hypothetical protein
MFYGYGIAKIVKVSTLPLGDEPQIRPVSQAPAPAGKNQLSALIEDTAVPSPQPTSTSAQLVKPADPIPQSETAAVPSPLDPQPPAPKEHF